MTTEQVPDARASGGAPNSIGVALDARSYFNSRHVATTGVVMTLARIFTFSFLFALSLHHASHVEPVHEFHFTHRRQHAHVAR